MKKLLLLLLFPAIAFAQPADRDVDLVIHIPSARLSAMSEICERVRLGMDEPIPDTITLKRCLRRVLFSELRQLNAGRVKRAAIRGAGAEINDFNTDLVD